MQLAEICQRRCQGRDALSLAHDDCDCVRVVAAMLQSKLDGGVNTRRRCLAMEHQHVDQLPCRFRRGVAFFQFGVQAVV